MPMPGREDSLRGRKRVSGSSPSSSSSSSSSSCSSASGCPVHSPKVWLTALAVLVVYFAFIRTAPPSSSMSGLFSFTVRDIDGADAPLSRFAGKVSLVVNVASQCGYTPQYAELQALQDELGARGFNVLAFPCNQFGAQEPGTCAQIKEFARTRFSATFPMFDKIDVKGANAHPLFKQLLVGERGAEIGWNFEKFLVAKDGSVVRRYATRTSPADIKADIVAELEK